MKTLDSAYEAKLDQMRKTLRVRTGGEFRKELCRPLVQANFNQFLLMGIIREEVENYGRSAD